ncbi:17-beta-hydroxysteroid dehydrogenase 14-like [Mercenaria mercenaria]|uniref:17-beta-hydroxysteroid dehydrogenase 14-like n=1 Tax=Mercenaria mercenaria TaxID=6596 RepID=UPI00234E8C7D|nr:17-beta-hydroxysteroid dehydrogenase 14-like [Mercenaria mercenaria]
MASGLRFKDKVAIITGGCSGIGEGCVEVFAENGGTVVVFDINDEVGNSLSIPGPGKIVYIHCDVTDEQQIKKSIESTVAKFGGIDCLVNDVGHDHGTHTIDELTVESFRQILDVNVVSMFAMSKYALPHLRKSRGSIVNISSLGGTNAQAKKSTYCSSKGAVISLSKALAIDEAKNGVRVNTVCPGPINTPLMRAWLENDDETRKQVESWTQLGRFGEPREIGLACLFLATEATFTTGTELMCTGGCEIGYGIKADF